MTIKELDEKIAALRQQSNQVLAEANRQMGAIDGQIAVYEQWKQSLADNEVSKNGTKPAPKKVAAKA